MNFKINLWTLLFLLAAGALYYVLSDDKTINIIPPSKKEIIVIPHRDVIDSSEFKIRYENYKERYIPVIDSNELDLKGIIGVDTMGIRYFVLEADELNQMYNHYSGLDDDSSQVYVYPVIKNGKREGGVQEIDSLDLVFLITDSKGDSLRYFDFTRPCPPTCDRDSVPKDYKLLPGH